MASQRLTPARFVALYELITGAFKGMVGGVDKRTLAALVDGGLIEQDGVTDQGHPMYRATPSGHDAARAHLDYLAGREAKGRMFRSDSEQGYQTGAAYYRAKLDEVQDEPEGITAEQVMALAEAAMPEDVPEGYSVRVSYEARGTAPRYGTSVPRGLHDAEHAARVIREDGFTHLGDWHPLRLVRADVQIYRPRGDGGITVRSSSLVEISRTARAGKPPVRVEPVQDEPEAAPARDTARYTRAGGVRAIVGADGYGWTRSGERWVRDAHGVVYELEKRRRNRLDETHDTGWYLYGPGAFGEFCGRRILDAVDEANTVIARLDAVDEANTVIARLDAVQADKDAGPRK